MVPGAGGAEDLEEADDEAPCGTCLDLQQVAEQAEKSIRSLQEEIEQLQAQVAALQEQQAVAARSSMFNGPPVPETQGRLSRGERPGGDGRARSRSRRLARHLRASGGD